MGVTINISDRHTPPTRLGYSRPSIPPLGPGDPPDSPIPDIYSTYFRSMWLLFPGAILMLYRRLPQAGLGSRPELSPCVRRNRRSALKVACGGHLPLGVLRKRVPDTSDCFWGSCVSYFIIQGFWPWSDQPLVYRR